MNFMEKIFDCCDRATIIDTWFSLEPKDSYVWNGKAYLPDCVGALLAQEPPPDEVIVVDNHSDDGSRDVVAERFPAVRVVDTGGNRGPCHARNVGSLEFN